jgi:hypothetical protein
MRCWKWLPSLNRILSPGHLTLRRACDIRFPNIVALLRWNVYFGPVNRVRKKGDFMPNSYRRSQFAFGLALLSIAGFFLPIHLAALVNHIPQESHNGQVQAEE